MKIRIAVACMLFSISVAAAQTVEDYDLACAVVATAEIATTQDGTRELDNAFTIFTFYLGRLTARNDNTDWSVVIKERISQMGEKSKSPNLYAECAEFYAKKLK